MYCPADVTLVPRVYCPACVSSRVEDDVIFNNTNDVIFNNNNDVILIITMITEIRTFRNTHFSNYVFFQKYRFFKSTHFSNYVFFQKYRFFKSTYFSNYAFFQKT